MADLEKFLKNIFPDLKEYKEQQKKYFKFVSFVCSFGEILLAISNKDNHIYDLSFLNPRVISKIERQLKTYPLKNQKLVEYLIKREVLNLADLFKLRKNPKELELFFKSIFQGLTEYNISQKNDDVTVNFVWSKTNICVFIFDEDLQLSELHNNELVIKLIKDGLKNI